MNNKHKIVVVPCDGPTLLSQSRLEWSLGYMFKVLYSTTPLFRPHSRITIEDVTSQERQYDDNFTVEYQTLTNEEYVTQQEAVSHGYSTILNRGQ